MASCCTRPIVLGNELLRYDVERIALATNNQPATAA